MNPFDSIFLVLFILFPIIGFGRGIGKEVLQFLLFILAVILSIPVVQNSVNIQSMGDVMPTLKFLGKFALGMYIGTAILSKAWTSLFLGYGKPRIISRIFGAIFALTKLTAILLGLHLTYAIHNPYMDRFRVLPQEAKDSFFLQKSDEIVEQAYVFLANHQIVTYHKIIWKEETQAEKNQKRMLDRFGVNAPTSVW